MTDLISFGVSGGRSVLVEMPVADDGLVPAGGRRNRIFDTGTSFSEHIDTIRDAMQEALRKFRESNPDEVKISFGIKFTAEAGAVIASTSLEGNLGVEMTWRQAAKE